MSERPIPNVDEMTPEEFVSLPVEDQMRAAFNELAKVAVGQRLVSSIDDLADLLEDPPPEAQFGETRKPFAGPKKD
ncbi:MAG: hypothetical protein AAFU41_08875 [Pseudomonadota bacterium]